MGNDGHADNSMPRAFALKARCYGFLPQQLEVI
jgi:hypothetical protein